MRKSIPFLLSWMLLFPVILNGQIITNPDSVTIHLFDTVWVDVLANDYEIGNDSIYLVGSPDNRHFKVFLRNEWLGKQGLVDSIRYKVARVNGPDVAYERIYIFLKNDSYDDLDINNLSARFYAFGSHFWDFDKEIKFFAPKGTEKNPIWTNCLWIGGMDSVTGQVHVSAERYRQIGIDYYAGPFSTKYDSLYHRKWNRIWKLTPAEIIHHIASYSLTGYTPIKDIAEWPAHGDTLNGQSWNIAPFHDSNHNGIYEPMAGDYPLIRGDMSLFFIFNDGKRPAAESGGIPLGIEVHGMAYGFDRPNDPMLNNTIFMHYDIINRSSNPYHHSWIGMFNNFYLGHDKDDYIATDVQNGAVYCYNATSVDGNGQPWAYGVNPPVMGMQMLGGPYLEPDGIDNPRTDSNGNQLCDVSINGANFGDGIADNERLGMSRSIFFGYFPDFMESPTCAMDYYTYLQGIWRDSTKMLYGNNGHLTAGAYGPECHYIFPGDSDPCHFGLDGQAPNGPVFWTSETAGNLPGSGLILASSGPFTFDPGSKQELDVAFVFAHSGVNDSSRDTLRDWFGKLKNLYLNDPEMFEPVVKRKPHNIPIDSTLKIYPNPASHYIILEGLYEDTAYPYQIFTVTGQIFSSGHVLNGQAINVLPLPSGVYLIRIFSEEGFVGRKFIRK